MKQILRPRRNCWAISPVDETGLLVDGRDYYRAFYQAAQRARRYILVAGWQFDGAVPCCVAMTGAVLGSCRF
jgi:hypothetical protein